MKRYEMPPRLMEELETVFRGRRSPIGYDLRRIAGQAKAEIERLQRELEAARRLRRDGRKK